MKNLFIFLFVLSLLTAKSQSRSSGFSTESKKNTGVGLLVGGVAFTAAAILEGPYNYGTYVTTSQSTPTMSQKVSYVTQPVWRQTPRNIMFCVGITLTMTGLITAISNR